MASLFRAPGPVRAFLLALGVAAATYVGFTATGLGQEENIGRALDTWIYYSILVGAAGACVARGFYRHGDRRPWLALAVAVLSWTAGDLYWTFFLRDLETTPFPSISDAFYLGFYPPAYVALVLLLRARLREVPRSLWLDGLIGGLTVAAIGAAVVFQAVLDSTEGSPLAVATNLAYPLGDLLLLGLVVGFLALTGWRADRSWIAIGAGLALFGVADSVYLYQAAEGSYVEGTLLDAGWVVAIVLLAFAAWQPVQEAKRGELEGWPACRSPLAVRPFRPRTPRLRPLPPAQHPRSRALVRCRSCGHCPYGGHLPRANEAARACPRRVAHRCAHESRQPALLHPRPGGTAAEGGFGLALRAGAV